MSIERIAENVYLQRHPLYLMGCRMGRVVTILRSESGKTLIHSTANFSESDAKEIRELGEPDCLLEATIFHDTTAREGRSAFPVIPYFVPSGFTNSEKLGAREIGSFDSGGEVKIIPVRGIPKFTEYSVFHAPSRTLILADLIFNLPDSVGAWTKWFLKTTVRLKSFPGQSALFRSYITDQGAYRASLQEIAELDFERIIVGHGNPIEDNAKSVFAEVLLGA